MRHCKVTLRDRWPTRQMDMESVIFDECRHTEFVRLSRGSNPLHTDAIAARRSQARRSRKLESTGCLSNPMYAALVPIPPPSQ